MFLYIRSEIDEHERMVITVYTTECWEVWVLRVTLIGDRPWITFNGPIASLETVQLYQQALRWARQFTLEGEGAENFRVCWSAQTCHSSIAKKVLV